MTNIEEIRAKRLAFHIILTGTIPQNKIWKLKDCLDYGVKK